MKRLSIICVLTALVLTTSAQRVSKSYVEKSMSDVLIDLDRSFDRYKISFIYNELEDFTVTKSVKNLSILDALRECIGFYPINMTVGDSLIVVECWQKSDEKLIGKVVDEHGEPIAFANISLLSPQDSCFITGGVSNENGDFVIPCDVRDILVRVSYVGYETMVSRTWPHRCGTIRMQPDQNVLNDVVVKGNIPRIQLNGSSLTMNIDGTILERIGTAEDILARIPTVIKKGETFEVLGKGTPVIYINGRQVHDLQELRNLQSDQIKHVEVVQNPGARYDATVNSVIVIRTKRPVGEGLGVEISSYSRRSRGFVNNERINLTYRKGGLELFAMGFGAYNKYKCWSDYVETTFSDNVWKNNHSETSLKRNNYFEGKLGFNYQPNDNHSLGAYYLSSYDKLFDKYTGIDELSVDDTPYDNLSNTLDTRSHWRPIHNANLYYNGTIGKLNIDFNADYVHKHITSSMSTEENSQEYADRDVNTHTLSKTDMAAEKLILTYPVWKGQLTLGEEFTSTKRINRFANAEGYLENNNNETKESNISPFVELHQRFGKVNMALGLRYEHTNNEYFIGDNAQEERVTYDNLFPSASLSWPLKVPAFISQTSSPVQMSLSYATRTRRPVYDQLKSNMFYENRFNLQMGNPLLKPSYIHNLSFMAMWRWLFLNANYSYNKDVIFYTTMFYNDDPTINLVTFINYPHRENLTLTLGINKTYEFKGVLNGTSWSPQWNVIMMKQWFTCDFHNNPMKFNKPIYVAQLNNVFSFPRDWLASLDYSILSTGQQMNANFRVPKSMFNMSVSKDFFDKSLNVKLSVNDLFNKWINHFTLYSNQMEFRKTEFDDMRYVCLYLRYRFNTTRSKYKGSGAGNDEKGRL